MSMPRQIEHEITGKQVLVAITIFFAILFLINGIFIYYAVSTFNGVETSDAYQSGLNYNQRIASDSRQKALGWNLKLDAVKAKQMISLSMQDKRGRPVAGLRINAIIGRPATNRFDQPLAFQENRPGSYTVNFEGLSGGNWLIAIEAIDIHKVRTDTIFRHKERIRVN